MGINHVRSLKVSNISYQETIGGKIIHVRYTQLQARFPRCMSTDCWVGSSSSQTARGLPTYSVEGMTTQLHRRHYGELTVGAKETDRPATSPVDAVVAAEADEEEEEATSRNVLQHLWASLAVYGHVKYRTFHPHPGKYLIQQEVLRLAISESLSRVGLTFPCRSARLVSSPGCAD
eukprot:4668230-Amphidinium_carterae.1